MRPLGFALSDVCMSVPGEHARSLNLANAASIALYEAYRQIAVRAGRR